MKHTTLFFAAISALTLASCANDEPVSVRTTDDAISFRSGLASRATETTNANLSSIFVTAFNGTTPYFENINYVKGSDSFFTSKGTKYDWPEEKINLQFYSYAPSADELGADITTDADNAGLKLENFAVAEDIADQVDFITASATGNKKDNANTGVELDFYHRLSQIEIQAKSENPTYTFKVTGVRIGRPEYVGTFDFTTNEWTLDDWHDTSVYTSSCDEVTLNSNPQSIMGPSGNAMLLPQTLTPWSPINDPDNVAREAYLSVLVQITRTDNGYVIYPFSNDKQKDATGQLRKYAWASIPLSGTWEQGKKYIYTLDFTDGAGNIDPDDFPPGKPVLGEPIKVVPQVVDWTEADIPTPMTPVK